MHVAIFMCKSLQLNMNIALYKCIFFLWDKIYLALTAVNVLVAVVTAVVSPVTHPAAENAAVVLTLKLRR